jgi:hypothetical protein
MRSGGHVSSGSLPLDPVAADQRAACHYPRRIVVV